MSALSFRRRPGLALALLAFSAFGLSSAQAQSLLLRYTFDDGAATDTSGATPAANGNIVTATTAPGFVTNTPSGSGLAFKTGGTGDAGYITTAPSATPDDASGDVARLDGLQLMTGSVWINLQGAPNSDSTPDRLFTDGGVNLAGFDFGISGTSASAIRLNLFTYSSTGLSSTSGTTLVDASNKWVFVAFTYDGSLTTNNVNYYVGTSTAAVSLLGTATHNSGTLGNNTRPFQVAGTSESTGDRTPIGFFDDVRVYSGVAALNFLETVRASNVPEPASAGLMLLGAGLLGARRRR